jgi:secreted PhoX family phosphatase
MTDDEEARTGPSGEDALSDVIECRLGRRAALKGAAAFAAAGAFGMPLLAPGAAAAAPSSLTFEEIAHASPPIKGVQAPPGYRTQVVVRWGDPVVPGAPAFDVDGQSAAAQARQFGYNNDFVAFMPLPRGSKTSDHGLLCVNHEYTNPWLMWPVGAKEGAADRLSKAQVDVEMAAHGHAVVEIERVDGTWRMVADSPYNRRLTAETPMHIRGPAAGDKRLRTGADGSGMRVRGTLNNCAGGTTPWGTVLLAEENVHIYFRGDPGKTAEPRFYRRYGLGKKGRVAWSRFHDRFDFNKEPNEPNRFGWVVEVDPYDPRSVPIKRTALGRFAHECATTVVNPDDTVTVYSGDDSRFDYLYRFVTAGRYVPDDDVANRHLLDSGTLSAARFEPGGTMTWLPLVHGTGPLTAKNGFKSQADVLINARTAADLMKATPMDRPEDVEANPATGRVYVMLTNNTKRKTTNESPANPRAKNRHGHIIELVPPMVKGRAHHGVGKYHWGFFLLGGDPARPADQAWYMAEVSANGWLSNPDNCTYDNLGRIWITTDGQTKGGFSDSVYAADTYGRGRGVTRLFFNAPTGAEICGPAFTPDNRTFFLAIQHPGDDKGSTFDKPSTRWPDFKPGMPPRPSVVAITRDDGGIIGS